GSSTCAPETRPPPTPTWARPRTATRPTPIPRTRSAGPSSYGAPYEIGRTVRVRAPPRQRGDGPVGGGWRPARWRGGAVGPGRGGRRPTAAAPRVGGAGRGYPPTNS